jgi:hypothetical protein
VVPAWEATEDTLLRVAGVYGATRLRVSSAEVSLAPLPLRKVPGPGWNALAPKNIFPNE